MSLGSHIPPEFSYPDISPHTAVKPDSFKEFVESLPEDLRKRLILNDVNLNGDYANKISAVRNALAEDLNDAFFINATQQTHPKFLTMKLHTLNYMLKSVQSYEEYLTEILENYNLTHPEQVEHGRVLEHYLAFPAVAEINATFENIKTFAINRFALKASLTTVLEQCDRLIRQIGGSEDPAVEQLRMQMVANIAKV